MLLLLTLVLFSGSLLQGSCSNNETCGTWLYRSEEGWCTCGSSIVNVITCNNQTGDVGIRDSFCLTSSLDLQHPEDVVAGTCLYAQNHGEATEGGAGLYVRVARNISEQDEQLCSYLNREGRLCGLCKPNHFVSAYSYDLKCYQCSRGFIGNLFAYITVAFVPQTLFLVAVVLLRVSFTSPRCQLAVFLCQIYATPECQRVIIQYSRHTSYIIYFKLLVTLYGVLNLDFFRAFIPALCLQLNTVQVIALDYLTAIYPLLLLTCFYGFLTAHDRGFRPVVWLWRPFFQRVARTRQRWRLNKNSIIDAFAVFFLLSYMKFVYTSIDLLMYTGIFNIKGSRVGLVLYYDATVDYFGTQHRPYGILAVAVVAMTLLFPVFLIIYPMKCFQKLLNRWNMNSPGLRTFIDCFQGSYRDRSDGGVECRYFSAVYPLCRLVGSTLYAITRNTIFIPALLLVFIAVAATVVVLRPYKKQYDIHNNLDALLLFSLMAFIAGYIIYSLSFDWYYLAPIFGLAIAGLFLLVPLVYFIILMFAGIRRALCRKNNTAETIDDEEFDRLISTSNIND